MVTIVRRVDPISAAKVSAAIYAILFLLAALPMGCAMSMVGSAFDNGQGVGAGFGLMAIILYPIVGAITGFIGGLVSAFVYNLVADRVGGIEIELDTLDREPDIL